MQLTHSTTATTLILALALVFFAGCSGNSEKAGAKVAVETLAANTPAETAEPETGPDTSPDTTAAPQPSPPEDGAGAPTEPPGENTETNPEPNTSAGGSGQLATRTVDEERLSVILDLIAQELEAQKLEYISSKGQDCSGIYHKIKDLVQRRMSVLGDKEQFHYPSYSADRNSRQIADWYYRQNNLHIVQDANADRNLITPGTVVFFGRTDEKYSNITIELLTNPGKFVHDGTNGKIMHVAVVTTVEKDDAGNVIKYDMMHGRNSRNFASRTTANYDGPGSYAKKHAEFPFGNWNQQLVALAHIETPK